MWTVLHHLGPMSSASWIGKGFLGLGNGWLDSVPFCLSFNELASWPIWTSNLLIAWWWLFIIEAWVLDKVSIILSKSYKFFWIILLLLLVRRLEVMLVIGLKIQLTLVETGLMKLSKYWCGNCCLGCSWADWLQWEIWMVPLSRIVCFGVWIVVGSGICCIHIFRIHLSLVGGTLLKQMVESMAVGTTWINHWSWVGLIYWIGSLISAVLASSSIVLFLPRQVLRIRLNVYRFWKWWG